MINQDSIVALATPSGAGAIAVIRISGEDAIAIGHSVFRSIKNKDLRQQKSHTLHLGHIVDGQKTWMRFWFLFSKGQTLIRAKTPLRFPVTDQPIFSSKLSSYYCEKDVEWLMQENLP